MEKSTGIRRKQDELRALAYMLFIDIPSCVRPLRIVTDEERVVIYVPLRFVKLISEIVKRKYLEWPITIMPILGNGTAHVDEIGQVNRPCPGNPSCVATDVGN